MYMKIRTKKWSLLLVGHIPRKISFDCSILLIMKDFRRHMSIIMANLFWQFELKTSKPSNKNTIIIFTYIYMVFHHSLVFRLDLSWNQSNSTLETKYFFPTATVPSAFFVAGSIGSSGTPTSYRGSWPGVCNGEEIGHVLLPP